MLKELFKSDSNFEELVPTAVENDSNVSTKISDSNTEQVPVAVENDSNVSTKTSDSNIEQVLIAVENDSNVSTKTSDSNVEQVPIAAVSGSNTSKKTSVFDFEDIVPIAVENDSNMSKKTPDFCFEQLVPVAVENDNNMSKKTSESSFEHLVPIAVKNDINVSNVVVPESLNPETKRKRGRPRKHENAVNIRPPAAKRMRNNTVKKVVVYDSEKDREIVNCRGVKINMADLGMLEDPYGPEIRRRTEGLTTQDELLGFLRAINGQWGTTRKKRRVVDASDFGDALPKGWRLSLCIKKKEGRVWLFCRRYISPSGRQFESCKDVSIYLLSIVGEKILDKPSHTRSNDSDDSALKGASENAADVYDQEDLEINTAIHNQLISLPTNCEKKVTHDILEPIVRAEEHFKCLKCFLIFDGKIDLLDHQALAHNDAGICDWSIVIGGIFDCRFCEKTFYEKNKYNAHVGSHVTFENKTCEASEALTAGKIVVVRETETHDAQVGDKPKAAPSQSEHKISCCTESKTDKLVHDLNMNGDVLVEESFEGLGNNSNVGDDEIFETQKASVSKSNFGLGHEASISTINESNGKFESSGGTVDCVDAKSECVFDHSSGNIQLSPSANVPDTVGVGKTLVCDSVSVEVFSHADSETRVQTLSFCEKKDFGENINDTQICSSFDELTFEKEKVVNGESSAAVAGVFHGSLAEANKLSEPESLSLFSPSCTNTTKAIKNTSFMRSSKIQDSSQKEGFPSVNENRFSYASASSKLDARYEVRSSAFDNYNMSSMDGDGVTSVEKEVNFKSHSPMNKETFHIQNNVNNAFLDKSGEANLDDLQIFRNNESINNEVATLGSSQNGLNSAGVMAFNTRKNIEFSSLAPPGSGNDQSFSFQDDDDVTGMYDSTQGGSSSERGLLDHFCVDEASDDIFGNKMMYSTPLDGLKFDEDRGLGIHDLNLAFGNPHALYEDAIQKKDGVNCSVVSSSKISNDTFDVQTDLSMVNKRMADDLKRVNDTRVLQHDGNNTVYSGRTWDNLRSDEYTSSENKFMIASGSNQQHCNEVVPRGMWKPAQVNQLQSGLVNPHSQIQAPSFHSFDIMSDKAEDGVYRVDERYNNNVGSTVSGVRSGRSEPVEFRFLTGRSEPNPPHALQGGSNSRGFPYNTAYEPPFWMGKNAMMPPNINMGGRNMVTSVCAWCRNVFYLPAMAVNPQAQAGVGSLCPNCTAGISGQVNML